jgi:hypothetical protein
MCASQSLPSYHKGGKHLNVFNNGKMELESLEKQIADIDSVILKQMESLKARYGSKLQRRTEITTKDYNFVEDESKHEKVLDDSYCCYEFKNGFLRKVRSLTGDKEVEYAIEATASSVLIAFDNRGRLLRVYCQDLPLNGSDIGTYLPTYFGLDETDDYKILWIGELTGDTLMLLYKDGNVGFVDTSEWDTSTRNVKVLQKGIATSVAPLLGAVLTEIPELLYVSDEEGNLAWVATDDLKRKDRTAKTRAFDLRHKSLLDTYLPTTITEGALFINDYGKYHGRLKEVENFSDIRGDVNAFKNMM